MDLFWFLVFNCFWERVLSERGSGSIVRSCDPGLGARGVRTVVKLNVMLWLIQVCLSINYV